MTKEQQKAFKKITKSKFPKKFDFSKRGFYIPNYVDFTDDYVAFVDMEKDTMILTISHRMCSDKIFFINKKGEIK